MSLLSGTERLSRLPDMVVSCWESKGWKKRPPRWPRGLNRSVLAESTYEGATCLAVVEGGKRGEGTVVAFQSKSGVALI